MNISPEVQGGLIGALLAGLFTFIGFYFRTHTGNKVIITKTADDILKGFHDKRGNSLTFNFKTIPVESLYFCEFKIINNGYVEIEDFILIVKVIPENETELLEVQLIDYLNKAEIIPNEKEKHSYTIKRPYLNMVRKDKEEGIFIVIFSDSPCDYVIYGGGKGWKTTFQKPSTKYLNPTMYLGLGGIVGLLIGIVDWFSRDGFTETDIVLSGTFFLILIFIIWLIAKVDNLQRVRLRR